MKSTIAAALLVSAWSSAGSAEALAPVPSSPGSGPRWFLVGGAHQPTLFQALGAGRALVCNDRRCDVWDGAAGAWKPTGAVVLPLNTLSSLRRQDGAVVAVDGARKIASAIWSPVTGRWTAAAALPEPLNQLRTAQLSDGRIVAVGQWRTGLRAYVADPDLRSWSSLIDSPDGLTNPLATPTGSGLLLLVYQRGWRHTIGTEGWREIPLAPLLLGRFPSAMAWQDQVLISSEDGKAVLVDRDGNPHVLAALPSGASFGEPISTADGMEMQFVSAGNAFSLWRRPDEAPIPLPANTIEAPYRTIALDDEHLLGVGASGAVTMLALDGKPPPGRSCDGLARYLAQVPAPMPAVSELQLVSAECRAEVQRGEALELVRLTRSWAGQAERVDYGRAFECAVQDPSALKVLPRWLEEKKGHAHSICYESLASWPGADAVWKPALRSAVWEQSGIWFVDSGVTAAAVAVPTGEMRERLMPAVRRAADRHASGFDALRDQVCTPDPAASAARRRTCAELASEHEAEWWRRKAEGDAKPSPRAAKFLVATAVYAGAIAGAYATRAGDAGRGIATAAGVLGGATLGWTATGVGLLSSRGWGLPGGSHGEESWLSVGALAGGILGGVAAYLAAGSPAGRAPATAAALAVPYLFTLLVVFD